MKRHIPLFFAAALLWAACGNREDNPREISTDHKGAISNEALTQIEWESTQKDFGNIAEGQQLEVTFAFKNVGNSNLVIKSVRPSCGCTAATPPEKPIPPGGTGEIKATFDSKGRKGANHKDLYVEANTAGDKIHRLLFDVFVD